MRVSQTMPGTFVIRSCRRLCSVSARRFRRSHSSSTCRFLALVMNKLRIRNAETKKAVKTKIVCHWPIANSTRGEIRGTIVTLLTFADYTPLHVLRVSFQNTLSGRGFLELRTDLTFGIVHNSFALFVTFGFASRTSGSAGSYVSLSIAKNFVRSRLTRRYRVTVLTSSKSES